MATGRRTTTRIRTGALLLSRTEYGDADLVVQLFTREIGRVSVMARGARRANSKYAGALEPMHDLDVELEERSGSDLLSLREATIQRPRLGLVDHLDALDVAGRALGWIRRTAPPRTAEPNPYSALEQFLDELDRRRSDTHERTFVADSHLAAFGMRLIESFGFGLELASCVSCGKPCPSDRPALLSPERGGLVCSACGGGPIRLGAPLRKELIEAARGQLHAIGGGDTALALGIVERALGAHMGIG